MRSTPGWFRACVFAVVVVAAGALSAQTPRRMEPADLVSLPRLFDPQISPAGDQVAFVVSRPGDKGQPETRTHVVAAEGGSTRELDAEGATMSPRWAPDGRRLAVVAPGETPRILVFDTTAWNSTVAHTAAGALRDLRWSPDGKQLAFLQVEPEAAEAARLRSEGRDARVVGEHQRHTRLHLLDLAAGASRPLTPPGQTIWRFSWSPDSQRIALLASAEPTAEGQEYRSALVLLDVAAGTRTTLAEKANAHAAPTFSPDGRSIVFLGPLGQFKERGVVNVVAAAGGPVVERLADDPGNVWDVLWHPAQADTLLAAVAWGTTNHLVSVAPDGATRLLVELTHSFTPYWDPNVTLSADGRRAAFLSEAGDRLEEVYVADLDGSGVRRRRTGVHDGLQALALGRVEDVRWTSQHAGRQSDVRGIVVWPPGAPAGRLPLVTVLHGGPAYNWGQGVQVRSWAQLFASRGYLVFLPNFRGSSGSGMAWMMANVRDWGDGPLADVLAGVDHLVERGWADPGRLFVGGASYGGYLTSWTVTHSDRFKAAWVTAGVSNLATEYALTDEPSFLVGYFGTTPYDDPEVYRAQSPVTHAGRARTPTLIVHGEQDLRVPVAQAHELHAALAHHGVKTRLVLYPREGHGIREPAHQLDYMERVLGWLHEHGGQAP